MGSSFLGHLPPLAPLGPTVLGGLQRHCTYIWDLLQMSNSAAILLPAARDEEAPSSWIAEGKGGKALLRMWRLDLSWCRG